MSGSGLPSGEFRWVEPVDASSRSAGSGRRWRWIGLVLVVVLVVAVGAVALHWWGGRDGQRGTAGRPAAAVEAPIGTPTDRLIGFGLSRQPVPGWQVSAADIGLPPQVRVGNMFATLGDTAYFVTSTGCRTDDSCDGIKGWVYGLDVKTGKKVLGPIELDGFWGTSDQCHTNGPSVAVCVTRQCDPGDCARGLKELGWVIDLARGEITFSGEPQVHAGELVKHPEQPYLREIGNAGDETRLVAAVKGKGTYGVGSHLEPTWFLPGSGDVSQVNTIEVSDAAPLTLGLQMPDRDAGQGLRVFTAEGKDVTPAPPDGFELGRNAQVYPGGFAVEYEKGSRFGGVSLFDADGKQVKQLPDARSLLPTDAMPVVQVGGQVQVFTAAGKSVATAVAGDRYRSIGTTLYAMVGYGHWQSMNLLTSQRGPTCELEMGLNYVGSDGSTIVWHDTTNKVFAAVDSATCRTQWTIEDHWATDAQTRLSKAGTGLLQVTENAIVGLRAA